MAKWSLTRLLWDIIKLFGQLVDLCLSLKTKKKDYCPPPCWFIAVRATHCVIEDREGGWDSYFSQATQPSH